MTFKVKKRERLMCVYVYKHWCIPVEKNIKIHSEKFNSNVDYRESLWKETGNDQELDTGEPQSLMKHFESNQLSQRTKIKYFTQGSNMTILGLTFWLVECRLSSNSSHHLQLVWKVLPYPGLLIQNKKGTEFYN